MPVGAATPTVGEVDPIRYTSNTVDFYKALTTKRSNEGYVRAATLRAYPTRAYPSYTPLDHTKARLLN